MKPISEFSGNKAEWIQPETSKRFFELQSGKTILATLSFRSMWGTLALAETADGNWTFKRVGFLNPRVTIRMADQPQDLAIYTPKFWGDGILSFQDGTSLSWKPINFWRTAWCFFDTNDSPLVDFHLGREKEKLSDILKTQANIEIFFLGAYRRWLPVLLPFGMYLLKLYQEDSAAAVIATSSTSAVM